MKYVALLRGINVGGNSIISMAKLKACFEKAGFKNVATYINSGNVVFESPEKNPDKLEKKLEAAIHKFFKMPIRVVAVSHDQMKEVISNAPKDWKTRTDIRKNVIFLKRPATVLDVLKESQPKPGVDFVKAGKEVLYFASLLKKLTQSGLPKIIAKKIYKETTIRTFGTVKKLMDMMEA